MSPPPAASHVATNRILSFGLRAGASWDRSAGRRARDWSRIRLALDAIVLYTAGCAALFAAPTPAAADTRWFAACFPLVLLVMLRLRPSPDDRLPGSQLEMVAHLASVVSLTSMLALGADATFGGAHPVGLALRMWLFSLVYLAVARGVLLSIRRNLAAMHGGAEPTLIVGAGEVGEHLVKRLTADPRYGLVPVGFLDADPRSSAPSSGPFVPVLGTPDDLGAAIERTNARHVILAFSNEPDHVLVQKVRECQERGVDVSLVPRLFELINERTTLNHVGGMPLVALRPTDPKGWEFAVKHAMDRAIAALALLMLSPLLIAIAIGVRLSSPGPILFRQRRVGRDGRPFDLLKFRTMRAPRQSADFVPVDGCAPGGVEGEDRRTHMGQLLRGASLDELPQLINVLKGQMSLVGPRPERPEFVARFSSEIARYQDRHRVKAGITGWAQVHGLRGQTSIADRVEWDNHYIQNWSLGLDLRVMLLTVVEVLRFRDSWKAQRAAERRVAST